MEGARYGDPDPDQGDSNRIGDPLSQNHLCTEARVVELYA